MGSDASGFDIVAFSVTTVTEDCGAAALTDGGADARHDGWRCRYDVRWHDAGRLDDGTGLQHAGDDGRAVSASREHDGNYQSDGQADGSDAADD